jgi:hypothetical protein
MKESPATQPASTPASQAEIRAIQERLQAIRAGQTAARSAPPSRMVEMFPSQSAAAGRASAVAAPAPQRLTDADVTAAVRAAAAEAQQAAELQQAAESLRAMSAALTSTFVRPYSSAATVAAPAEPSAKTRVAVASGRVSHPEAPSRAELPSAEVMRLLEVKADEINQLSAAQEAAMLELKAIAQKLERDWKALNTQQHIFASEAGDLPALCEYLETEVPLVQRDEKGAFVVTKRPVDLFQAERDAEWMAQSLRHRGDGRSAGSAGRGRRTPSGASAAALFAATAQQALRGVLALLNRVLLPSDRQRLTRSMQRQSAATAVGRPPMTEAPSVQTSAMLLIGAAIARIGADWLLAVNAGFWLPVALLIVAPAALAIYRTTVAPHTSVAWGYRIFLIFIGLLIGGRVL